VPLLRRGRESVFLGRRAKLNLCLFPVLNEELHTRPRISRRKKTEDSVTFVLASLQAVVDSYVPV
jgi:hypothetical protein